MLINGRAGRWAEVLCRQALHQVQDPNSNDVGLRAQ